MLRILYNSRDPSHKDPLGTIIPGQTCTLRMKIPQHCETRQALCRLLREDGTLLTELPMDCQTVLPPYETWTCQFTLEPGLYFQPLRLPEDAALVENCAEAFPEANVRERAEAGTRSPAGAPAAPGRSGPAGA